MISQEQLNNLVSRYQTTQLNVKREYFQHLFLSYFYQQPQTSSIYFKGGTALRILYNSPRFSEDLDFSALFYDTKEIEKALEETLNQLEKEGINVNIQESKPTSDGFLANIEFENVEGTVLIQLEISLREGEKSGEVVTVASDFVPAYTVVALASEQLVEEKIQALLSRKKPRDFYDLYFLLRSNLISPTKKSILPQALMVLKKTDINFEIELKQFLPKSHWAIIRDFKPNLEREIGRFQ